MAKLSILLDTRNKKAQTYPVVIRVSHKSKWKYIQTGFKVKLNEWNKDKSVIKKPFPNLVRANAKIQKTYALISEVLSDHNAVIKNISHDYLVNIINTKLEENDKNQSSVNLILGVDKLTTLKNYGENIVAHTRKTRTPKYANSIQEAINYLLKFHGNNKLLLTEIDIMFLENLEAYYRMNSQRGNSINGLGVHLRSIRKIINAAIKDKTTEVTMEHYPFGSHGYSIKKSSTAKRAIDLEEIEKIKNLTLEPHSPLWHHQNYFVFYFYMRGMNFIDLVFLRMNNIQNGRLVYRRRKTKRGENVKEFTIKINTEAQKILNYYTKDKKATDLIFPILEDHIDVKDDQELNYIYEYKRGNHNRRLKTIAKMLDIDVNLTSYVARHSFASAGLRKGLSKAEIGDMLGHTNYYTTETYLNGFEQETLDSAADKIFDF